VTNLSDLTVLIVDPSGQTGFEYRKSFVDAGAAAHVIGNFAAAEKLLETKKIDAAVVHYSRDAETVSFCRVLTLKNIPCIFTSEPPARYPTRKPMSEAILAVQAILARQILPNGYTLS
jgi:hypothetical protein